MTDRKIFLRLLFLAVLQNHNYFVVINVSVPLLQAILWHFSTKIWVKMVWCWIDLQWDYYFIFCHLFYSLWFWPFSLLGCFSSMVFDFLLLDIEFNHWLELYFGYLHNFRIWVDLYVIFKLISTSPLTFIISEIYFLNILNHLCIWSIL